MLAGNPDTFAILVERVTEWDTEGCTGGLMHFYIDGKVYPRKPRVTPLNTELPHLFAESGSAFVRPKVSRKLYELNGKKLFRMLRRMRYPSYYGDDKEADEDYRFDVTLDQAAHARYHVFVVTDGQNVRLLIGRWGKKKRREKFRFLGETEITAEAYRDLINRVYVYYHNTIERACTAEK